MNLTIAPNGVLQIDGARLIHRNFSGEGSKFNREGDRNFSIVIPDEEMAQELINEGWNVKIKPPRDEYEEPFMFLSVKVKFNDRGPNVYLKSGRSVNKLDEDTIGILDSIQIDNADLDIRPYDWEVSGKEGRSAYLLSADIIQNVTDRFASRYEDEEF